MVRHQSLFKAISSGILICFNQMGFDNNHFIQIWISFKEIFRFKYFISESISISLEVWNIFMRNTHFNNYIINNSIKYFLIIAMALSANVWIFYFSVDGFKNKIDSKLLWFLDYGVKPPDSFSWYATGFGQNAVGGNPA